MLTFALLCAGYSLLPDLDHDYSTATRMFGWASWVACKIVQPTSWLVYRLTGSHRDTDSGMHRGLTHTALFAVSVGVAVNAAIDHWGRWVTALAVFVGVALGLKGLDHLIPGRPSLLLAGIVTAGVIALAPWAHSLNPMPWVGTAVSVGVLAHCLGDALTYSGCPLLAPLPIRGRRWYPIRTPWVIRFRTGGSTETGVLIALTAITLALTYATLT